MCLRYSAEGGGPDHVELAPGQHWLEHVPGVHRPLCRPGANDRVQLIDEEEDPAFCRLHLAEHGLETLLELPPVLGPRDQGPHVQCEHRLVPQPLRDITPHDALGQPLDDGGLADPRVSDEDGVVLGLPGQDLDRTSDLAVTADHRVELAAPGVGDQVSPVLLQGLVCRFGRGRSNPLIAPDGRQRLEETISRDALIA